MARVFGVIEAVFVFASVTSLNFCSGPAGLLLNPPVRPGAASCRTCYGPDGKTISASGSVSQGRITGDFASMVSRADIVAGRM